MIEEELYRKAVEELDSDSRQPHIWARACALASNDQDEARYLYTNLRVEELLAERDAAGFRRTSSVDETQLDTTVAIEPIREDVTADMSDKVGEFSGLHDEDVELTRTDLEAHLEFDRTPSGGDGPLDPVDTIDTRSIHPVSNDDNQDADELLRSPDSSHDDTYDDLEDPTEVFQKELESLKAEQGDVNIFESTAAFSRHLDGYSDTDSQSYGSRDMDDTAVDFDDTTEFNLDPAEIDRLASLDPAEARQLFQTQTDASGKLSAETFSDDETHVPTDHADANASSEVQSGAGTDKAFAIEEESLIDDVPDSQSALVDDNSREIKGTEPIVDQSALHDASHQETVAADVNETGDQQALQQDKPTSIDPEIEEVLADTVYEPAGDVSAPSNMDWLDEEPDASRTRGSGQREPLIITDDTLEPVLDGTLVEADASLLYSHEPDAAVHQETAEFTVEHQTDGLTLELPDASSSDHVQTSGPVAESEHHSGTAGDTFTPVSESESDPSEHDHSLLFKQIDESLSETPTTPDHLTESRNRFAPDAADQSEDPADATDGEWDFLKQDSSVSGNTNVGDNTTGIPFSEKSDQIRSETGNTVGIDEGVNLSTDSLSSESLPSDSLSSHSLSSDSLSSDSLSSDSLTSDSLTSDSLTSDSLTSDSLTSDSLSFDSELEAERQEHLEKDLDTASRVKQEDDPVATPGTNNQANDNDLVVEALTSVDLAADSSGSPDASLPIASSESIADSGASDTSDALEKATPAGNTTDLSDGTDLAADKSAVENKPDFSDSAKPVVATGLASMLFGKIIRRYKETDPIKASRPPDDYVTGLSAQATAADTSVSFDKTVSEPYQSDDINNTDGTSDGAAPTGEQITVQTLSDSQSGGMPSALKDNIEDALELKPTDAPEKADSTATEPQSSFSTTIDQPRDKIASSENSNLADYSTATQSPDSPTQTGGIEPPSSWANKQANELESTTPALAGEDRDSVSSSPDNAPDVAGQSDTSADPGDEYEHPIAVYAQGTAIELLDADYRNDYCIYHRDGKNQIVNTGASWSALLLTFPYLIFRHMPGAAVVYALTSILLLTGLIVTAMAWHDAGTQATPLLQAGTIGFGLLCFLAMIYLPFRYGNRWRCNRLHKRGFELVATVNADSKAHALSRARTETNLEI